MDADYSHTVQRHTFEYIYFGSSRQSKSVDAIETYAFDIAWNIQLEVVPF